MRRIAVIFLVAVFAPSLVLGLLALRTAGEQRAILERQLAELYQKDVDQLAKQLEQAILDRQRSFGDRVRAMLAKTEPRAQAEAFARLMEAETEGVAFVVAPSGRATVARPDTSRALRFLRENGAFLNNRAETELFPTQQLALTANWTARRAANETAVPQNANNARRTVRPQSTPDAAANASSRVTPLVSDFETAIAGGTDGVLARYTQNALELIFWTRPPRGGGSVFGLALPARSVNEMVRGALESIAPDPRDACIAVLDENAQPVALSRPNFTTDWKRPFVSSEIGKILPHWETSLYLLNPGQPAQSARLVTLTLVLLIALALAAILAGGGFVALDARRQLALAQKKTDFVSNVSHELKTPLTSIRMFAELLDRGRPDDPEKRSRYLRIIVLETERLTRLINNVLDFARSDRKQRTYHMADIDLQPVIERAWEAQELHLREAGFRCEREAQDAPYPVHADADAIGQVLVNLLSNAEKYSGDQREIFLRSERAGGCVRVAVLDRGPGVPAGEEERIFEPFHRANDSLASGVQGSGLGLTLARRIARDHGGEIEYHRRDGGGSVFTLRLPVRPNADLS